MLEFDPRSCALDARKFLRVGKYFLPALFEEFLTATDLADSGEDAIAYCPGSDYAANIELAEAPEGSSLAAR